MGAWEVYKEFAAKNAGKTFTVSEIKQEIRLNHPAVNLSMGPPEFCINIVNKGNIGGDNWSNVIPYDGCDDRPRCFFAKQIGTGVAVSYLYTCYDYDKRASWDIATMYVKNGDRVVEEPHNEERKKDDGKQRCSLAGLIYNYPEGKIAARQVVGQWHSGGMEEFFSPVTNKPNPYP